jgi:hypothetical protein
MLFLTKKTMVSVLALGTLLSVGNVQAVWTPNAAQVTTATVAFVGYLHHHKSDGKDKNVAFKAVDKASDVVHAVVDCPHTKTATVAVLAGLAVHNRDAIISAVKAILSGLKG